MSLAVHFTSRRVQRLAERAALGALSERGRQRLARQLERSEADREAYDRLLRLFRALEGGPLLAATQQEQILGDLLHETGRGLRGAKGPGWALGWLAPLASVLLLGVALTLLLQPTDDGLQPRGSRAPLAQDGHVGLGVYCIRGGEVVPPPPRESGLDARCRLDDELQLVVTNTGDYGQLLVIGVQQGGAARRWYYPLPPTGRSGPAPREVADDPLGQALALKVNHHPGPLRLVAVFSRSPLQADQLFAWIDSLAPHDRADLLVERLAGSGSDVKAVELRGMIEGDGR